MKTRYTTIDLFASMHDVQSLLHLHCQNVYDIDNKTYLLKFHKPDGRAMLLMESGTRIHNTDFEWPKNHAPSGFSMKLRKHIKQKRLKSAVQLGVDRIVDLQFGEGDRACHVIVELYDRGNIVLTDHEYVILNILRPRTDKDTDVRFAVRQKYPVEMARQPEPLIDFNQFKEDIMDQAKPGENLRKILTPKFLFGPSLLEHCLRVHNLQPNAQLGIKVTDSDYPSIYSALELAQKLFLQIKETPCKGFIITKIESKSVGILMEEGENDKLETFQEFHPMLFHQHTHQTDNQDKAGSLGVLERESFVVAVDEFFSQKESQKIDVKALQLEKEAMKKLDNIKKDHKHRLASLEAAQEEDMELASLIQMNQELVERAILVVRSALANQISWEGIEEMVEEGRERGDVVASAFSGLKLGTNHITLTLRDPFHEEADEEDAEESYSQGKPKYIGRQVDIDLNLNAHQNARKYFVHKKQANVKHKKTVDASKKALKSAELKTQETLQQVQIRTTVQKHRKTHWFEKFLWFISSENYMVVGGRDAQQNELLVKRYLRPGDVYVHADLRGASSVIIKNKVETEMAPDILPKTLNEAGAMAVCCSAAWEAKVVAGAWWVRHDQVSKTAPSGEYLVPGSFMIRGKKNFLPPAQLQMGFGFLFRLDEDCVERHKGERERGEALSDTNKTEGEVGEEEGVVLEGSSGEEEEADDPKDTSKQSEDESFPDVAVRLKHLSVSKEEKEEYTLLQLGPKRPDKPRYTQLPQDSTQNDPDNNSEEKKEGVMKRGQKHKQRKAKEKYKDQDEEERTRRMDILGATGEKKEKKRKGKGKNKGNFKTSPNTRHPLPTHTLTGNTNTESTPTSALQLEPDRTGTGFVSQYTPNVPENENPSPKPSDCSGGEAVGGDGGGGAWEEENKEPREEGEEDEEEGGSEVKNEMSAALDSLTATPLADDVLLFAVPVCAPYSALNNYKFKVKLTPGTGKKGKATKTATQIFIKDRDTTQRERDLLKAAMDQDLARNVPGKVKLSAPHLLAVKQKKVTLIV